MATLLSEVNNVLTLMNAQRVSSVTDNDLALKVKLALEQAIRQIVLANNQWPWLQTQLASTSWTGETAMLDSSVLDVKFIRYDTSVPIQYVEAEQFFSRTNYAGSEPLCYTRIGETYYFYPYPDTDAERDKVRFHVIKTPSLPQADTEEYDSRIPVEFFDLFRASAMAELSVNHLADAQMAQYYNQRTSDLLALLRSKRVGQQLTAQSVIAYGDDQW